MRFIIISLVFLFYSCGGEKSNQEINQTNDTPDVSKVVEKTPEAIIKEAEEKTATMLQEAQDNVDSLIFSAEDSASITLGNANKEAEEIISSAQDSASIILENANKEAEQITSRTQHVKELLDEYSLLWLSVLSLLIISVLAYLVFRIWTWRKEYDQGAVIIPEQMSDYLKGMSQSISELLELTNKGFELAYEGEDANKNNEEIQARIQRILDGVKVMGQSIADRSKEHASKYEEALTPLRDTISTQQEEIDRFKEGYDNKVKQQFLLRLISMKERIENHIHSGSKEVQEAMERILEPLNFIFEQEGVSSFSFKMGEKLETLNEKQIEVVERTSSDDTLKVGLIHKTIKLGYLLKSQDSNPIIIRRAKVAVYVERKDK